MRPNTRPGLADGHLVRAVVDVNVLISATLSARGPSAEILRNNRDGAFELVVSELLIAELTRALAYPKLRKRIPARAHARAAVASPPVYSRAVMTATTVGPGVSHG